MFGRRNTKPQACHGFVSGRVQSVAFRFYTRQEATQLRLTGWVRNLEDGRVEFHVQGPAERVGEFMAWIEKGPPLAQVQSVESEECEPEMLDVFDIL
jgi:acylphosphatase